MRTSPEDGKRSVVDVVGISALAKVAKAYGSLILDHHEDGAHSYYVDAGTMLYRYRPGSAVAHQVQYAPGHHRGGASPVTSRLSQRALRTPFRGLSPSPWTFGIAPLSARHGDADHGRALRTGLSVFASGPGAGRVRTTATRPRHNTRRPGTG